MWTYVFLFTFILISLQPITEALDYEAIYGGDNASPEQFPYVVFVELEDGKFCTGVIVNEKYVVTAAQCVAKTGEITANYARIIAGTNNLKVLQDAVFRYVKQILIRYDFNTKSHEHDIALLLLSEGLNCTETGNIRKVDLAVADSVFDDATVTVVGFGQGSNECKSRSTAPARCSSDAETGKLTFVETRILDNDKCQEHYKKNVFSGYSKKTPKITANMLCAQIDQHIFMTQPSVCRGDNGGPLIVTNKAKRLTALVGILSLTDESSKCDGSNTPSIFTKIARYMTFFQEVIVTKRYNPNELISKKLEVKQRSLLKSGVWDETQF